MLKNTTNTYGSMAKFLHWLIALMVISLIGFGLYMTDLPNDNPVKFQIYGVHKAFGVIVFCLVLIRILWRWVNVAPSLSDDYPSWQKFASRVTHYGLYILMFTMPLSGILMSLYGGHAISIFGLFVIPAMTEGTTEISAISNSMHHMLVTAWLGILGLHIAAALYHHFILKDNILRRMLPWGR